MYLTEHPALTATQQVVHSNSVAMLRELRGLRALARDLDDARSDYECVHSVDASFGAEEMLEHFIAALGEQLEACGLALPVGRL